MSFRVPQNSTSPRSLVPRAERWTQYAREFVFEDWTLKLLALAISVGLWFAVNSQRAPSTIRLRGVPLTFLLPADTEISNDPRNDVEVTLTGSKQKLDELNVRNLAVNADVAGYRLGERVVRLTKDNVTMELPDGVRIEKIEPSTVPLRLERRVEKILPVEVRLEGSPAQGNEVLAKSAMPNQVRVRGPESHVNQFAQAPTETVTLDGRSESFTVTDVAIDIADPKVVALDPVVAVTIQIAPRQIERRFSAVRAIYADAAQANHNQRVAVVLRGAATVLETLQPEQIEIIFESDANGNLAPRLNVPREVAGKVSLVGVAPTK